MFSEAFSDAILDNIQVIDISEMGGSVENVENESCLPVSAINNLPNALFEANNDLDDDGKKGLLISFF